MKIACDDARSLVPSYLDGELSETQASALRAHLMDCPACREVAKEGRVLERWFEALRTQGSRETTTVPEGFSARVARRAFAGDPGLLIPEERPALPARPAHLRFLLIASSVAAVVLFVLALAIQRESLPRTNGLQAQEDRPPWLEASNEAPQPANERLEDEDKKPAKPRTDDDAEQTPVAGSRAGER